MTEVYFAKKCTFWRVKGTLVKCFFCKNKTNYILVYRDGGENWSCKNCLWNVGKIKRFKPKGYKSLSDNKSEILGLNSSVKVENIGVSYG